MKDTGENGAPGVAHWPVPLALVATILIQAGGALVWAGATSARIDQLETSSAEQDTVAARTIRLEEQTRQIGAAVERIEVKLDRLSLVAGDDRAAKRDAP
jgi:hypothetical protein